ncbi:cysteine desulfurase family protein [Actinospica sp.]|jgi:cysteine desulfurase|uniref:cysteine desulfurase family protein n=1 Tax=Actinospica sp. TaxID=1872142 RepID=UPI002BFDCC28|nr:cysteine desulfurase family protein [Actinospica sp.]HWG26552.1 cysteine desulfurase family protein [Actinospica sp.]
MTYLDHAATTPLHPDAIAALNAQLDLVGNANSLHGPGRAARRVVEESREAIAAAFGARPSHIVFTGGGTEADNLAVKGLYWARREEDPRRVRIVAARIEHHAVLDALFWLEQHEGAEISWLPVQPDGSVRPQALEEALAAAPETVALVTVMWANNEVGTVLPIAELAGIAHRYDVPIHSDAIQAAGHLPVDFAASGLDAMAITGHKLGGPIGVGALLLGRETRLTALQHGGGQERDVRSGTLDTPAIAAFAAAATAAHAAQPAEFERLSALRDRLIEGVLATVPDAVLSGPPLGQAKPGDAPDRLPGIAHFCFPGCEGDSLLLLLDARGISCSTGSACSAGIAQPSHVLLAMGAGEDLARGSLRFSLGRTSTDADVDAVLEALPAVVTRARAAGLS